MITSLANTSGVSGPGHTLRQLTRLHGRPLVKGDDLFLVLHPPRLQREPDDLRAGVQREVEKFHLGRHGGQVRGQKVCGNGHFSRR